MRTFWTPWPNFDCRPWVPNPQPNGPGKQRTKHASRRSHSPDSPAISVSLKRLNRWQGAWVEAIVEGSGNDTEWNEYFDQQYRPEDRSRLQEDFRKFYGLSKDDEFGQSTGLKETITIFLNGRQIASAQGIVIRSGPGFHGTPDKYTLKCKPTLVKFEPVHQT
jgi:hypothetical protein